VNRSNNIRRGEKKGVRERGVKSFYEYDYEYDYEYEYD